MKGTCGQRVQEGIWAGWQITQNLMSQDNGCELDHESRDFHGHILSRNDEPGLVFIKISQPAMWIQGSAWAGSNNSSKELEKV